MPVVCPWGEGRVVKFRFDRRISFSETPLQQSRDFFAHVTHTSCIADHKGKHDAKGANIFHKNGT